MSQSGGVGWGGVGYIEQLGYRGQPSLSAHSTTLVITWNYWGAKFNYNHTPIYLELLREQKFNYNHTLECVKLRHGSFLLSTKRKTQ